MLLNTIKTNNPIKKWVWELKKHSSKEDIQMVNKHMERCSTLFITREKEMRYHLTPVRMAIIIKKFTNNKCWRRCGKKGILLHCRWECKLLEPLWGTVWRLLKKLWIKLPYDPAIPLLGIHHEETITEKDTCNPMFTVPLFTISRIQKQPRYPSTDERIKRLWYIHTMEYYSAIKKEHSWISSKEVDEHNLLYTVKKVRKRKISIVCYAYIWNLEKRYWLNYFQGRNRETDIENGLLDTVGEGEGRTNRESSNETYILSYVK